jgi:DNA polymerase-4
VTARKLRARGIERLVDVRRIDARALRDVVGSLADWLVQLSHGIDDRPVVANRETKSAGTENTYVEDLTELDRIRAEVADMAADAAGWLERRGLSARTVVVKVRYGDFTTITRSHTARPTRDRAAIVSRALELLGRTEAGRRPVRLLGVSVHNLQSGGASDSSVPQLPFP